LLSAALCNAESPSYRAGSFSGVFRKDLDTVTNWVKSALTSSHLETSFPCGKKLGEGPGNAGRPPVCAPASHVHEFRRAADPARHADGARAGCLRADHPRCGTDEVS